MSNANDFLMGGGVKSLRIAPKNTPAALTITQEPEVRQQTDYDTKEPKFFKGTTDPMMQLVVTGSTTQRDPDNALDDGTRAAYIKGKHLTGIVRDAVRMAGAKGLEVGGVLTLTWVSGGPRYEGDTAWQKESPKVFTASYVKPVGQAQAAFFAEPTAAAAQPVQQQPPAATGDEPARPASVDPALWDRLSLAQKFSVANAA